MHVERTFTVRRPIEEVFEVLSDFRATEQWDPGTLSTTRESGDGDVGTTYRNRSQFMGREVELTYTTVVHDRPTKVRFEGRNDKALTHDTMTFSPADGDAGGAGSSTRIHYRADFDLGRVLNLVAPLVLRRKLDALADETVDQLTAFLERPAA